MNLHSTRLRAALGAAIAVTTAAAPLAFAGGPGVTEPRNCAWVAKIDPNGVNALFPDQAARYWILDLPAAPGTNLTIKGRFPHARYTSFTSNDAARGRADGLPDIAITPDHGSTTPFVAGAWRQSKTRSYTVLVVQGSAPGKRGR